MFVKQKEAHYCASFFLTPKSLIRLCTTLLPPLILSGPSPRDIVCIPTSWESSVIVLICLLSHKKRTALREGRSFGYYTKRTTNTINHNQILSVSDRTSIAVFAGCCLPLQQVLNTNFSHKKIAIDRSFAIPGYFYVKHQFFDPTKQ